MRDQEMSLTANFIVMLSKIVAVTLGTAKLPQLLQRSPQFMNGKEDAWSFGDVVA